MNLSRKAYWIALVPYGEDISNRLVACCFALLGWLCPFEVSHDFLFQRIGGLHVVDVLELTEFDLLYRTSLGSLMLFP